MNIQFLNSNRVNVEDVVQSKLLISNKRNLVLVVFLTLFLPDYSNVEISIKMRIINMISVIIRPILVMSILYVSGQAKWDMVRI